MNDMQTHEHELISALADGQLDGDAFAAGVQLATRDAAGRAAWERYHLIGEVMRSADAAAGITPAEVFLSRLQGRLQAADAEDAVPVAPRGDQVPPLNEPAVARAEAANDASWRWKWLAGLASVAAVSAIGWNVAAPSARPQPQFATVATPPAAPAAGVAAGRMIRDPRLDQLLAAHRQLGGASALQTPSGFLRNATFEAPGR